MILFDLLPSLLLSAAVFAGAVVSGLVGFAFSAVAGAVLLHVLPPIEAVPLMMACSIVTQAISLVALRGAVQWRGSPMLIAGGALGMLPALYLLHHVDAHDLPHRLRRVSVRLRGLHAAAPRDAHVRDAPGRLHAPSSASAADWSAG